MKKKIALVALAAAAVGVQAADWSDTSIALTSGTKFGEPYLTKDTNSVAKNIFTFKNVSGDKYGQNFFAADLLQSNAADSGTGSSSGAQEVYVAYRRLFDLQKITGNSYAYGPVKNVGVTAGFDWNTKNDSYGSKKRMLVAGPTLMMDVKQGFFDISLLLLNESNDPNGDRYGHSSGRYHYNNHADLSLAWGVATGINNLGFEGRGDYIAAKGKSETGNDTKPETYLSGALMYDVSAPVGAAKNTFKLGAGFEYWKNKFGNDYTNAATGGPGAFTKTPFVKAEYHF